jgi:serine-type D-Ala-D-Ala carboxypeptidase/endopeptidase (penicillin-binding protein 4)
MNPIRRLSLWGILLSIGLALSVPAGRAADPWSRVRARIGPRDAILVTHPDGRVICEKHADGLRVPASTLKLLTALVALKHLGADYRFPTDFYLDPSGNLIVKGYGDPLLISEVLADLARSLAEAAGDSKETGVEDIVLDNTHFAPVKIPGVTTTLNPYDAPNGALCANFNTVVFARRGTTFVSGEPQTPLLPVVLHRVRRAGGRSGRVILSQENEETTHYAGHLLRHFLEASGIRVRGEIRLGAVNLTRDRHLFRHLSPFTLTDVIEKLMAHSNNFIANQILVAAGIAAEGPPGTLDKGVRTATAYARQELGIAPHGLKLAEGSGISRDNRISARATIRILNAFAPYRSLLKTSGPECYKSGTLSGISTRAGYIRSAEGTLYRYAIFFNSPGKSAEHLAGALVRILKSDEDY